MWSGSIDYCTATLIFLEYINTLPIMLRTKHQLFKATNSLKCVLKLHANHLHMCIEKEKKKHSQCEDLQQDISQLYCKFQVSKNGYSC